MLKQHKKQLIISSLITLAPVLIGLLLWNQLPDLIPTHWGFDGNPDRWSSKTVAVFVIPILLVLIQFVGLWATGADPKNRNQSSKVMRLMLWIVPLISVLCCGAVYATALGYQLNTFTLVGILLGVIFIMIGNYLPKCTQSYTIGIKVPWALADEENWNATHRFSGKVWFLAGVITLFSVLLPVPVSGIVMVVTLLSAALSSVLYSYLYYRNHKNA